MTEMMNPECATGKHGNCYGDSWDNELDGPADCPCDCHRPVAVIGETP